MAEPRKYVPRGNVRSRQTPFGEVLSVGFDVKELIKFAEENKNERGFLNLTISPRKVPDENATHSVYLDDWKPTRGTGQQRPAPRQQSAPAPTNDGCPPPDGQSGVPF